MKTRLVGGPGHDLYVEFNRSRHEFFEMPVSAGLGTTEIAQYMYWTLDRALHHTYTRKVHRGQWES